MTQIPLLLVQNEIQWKDAAHAAKCTGAVCLPLNSSAGTAAAATAGRCCNPTPSTGTTFWRCNQKYKGDTVCATPSLREEEIKECFVAAFNQLLGDKEQYIARFEELLPIITDTTELEQHLAELQSGHDAKMQLLKGYIEENKHQVQDQAEYTERYNALHDECQQLEAQIARLESKIHARQSKKEEIRRWLDKLRQCGDILTEFDPDLWNSTVETVTVGKEKLLTFRFKDGTEIPVPIPDKK